MNHRTLFTTYHMGFDNYNAWAEYVHDMWDKHDLGCERFGEKWLQLWEALGRVLASPAYIECRTSTSHWFSSGSCGTVGECILKASSLLFEQTTYKRRRVALVAYPHEVIHEWGAR